LNGFLIDHFLHNWTFLLCLDYLIIVIMPSIKRMIIKETEKEIKKLLKESIPLLDNDSGFS
jgi:O-antigen/teichoic acid export membrane protein